MKTRNEELRYMFRQPLLCLACAAPTTRIAPLDAFEPCRGMWLHLPCSQIPGAPRPKNTRSLTFDKPFASLL